MTKIYAPLPFSYLSAGAPNPRVGLRKDEGLYGSRADSNKNALEINPTTGQSMDRRLPIGNRLAAVQEQPTIPEMGSGNNGRRQPEVMYGGGRHTPEVTYGGRYTPEVSYGGQPQPPGTVYGNLQQPEMDISYGGGRYPLKNNVPALPRVMTPISPTVYGNVQETDSEYSARAYTPDRRGENVRVGNATRAPSVYPSQASGGGGHVTTGPQVYESMEFNDISGGGGDHVRTKPRSTEHPGIFDNFIFKGPARLQPEVVAESSSNAVEKREQLHDLFQPREEYQHPAPDNRQIQTMSKPNTGNAFDRPDYLLYAGYPNTGGTGQLSTERTPSFPETPTEVAVLRTEPVFQTSSAPPTQVEKTREDTDGDCCCSCRCSRCCCVVIAIIITAIICIGAGFIAGWFGYQAYLAAATTATTTTVAAPISIPNIFNVTTKSENTTSQTAVTAVASYTSGVFTTAQIYSTT